jgi:hypothetical protein
VLLRKLAEFPPRHLPGGLPVALQNRLGDLDGADLATLDGYLKWMCGSRAAAWRL